MIKVFEDNYIGASTPENGKEYWYITNEFDVKKGIFYHTDRDTYGLNDNISGQQPVYDLLTHYIFRKKLTAYKFVEKYLINEQHEKQKYIENIQNKIKQYESI